MIMKYVTIEREYGSGGTQIAAELARRCQIACYGKEILEAVSKKFDVSTDQLQHYEESTTKSALYSLYLLSQIPSGSDNMLTGEGQLYVEEQTAIWNFARLGSAVFIGHCASEALKDYDNVIRVFIYADKNAKQERIRREYGIDVQDIEAVRKRFDKKRANYYLINTSKKWDDFHNYDIVLDSTKFGINGCVNILEGIYRD